MKMQPALNRVHDQLCSPATLMPGLIYLSRRDYIAHTHKILSSPITVAESSVP